LYQNLAIFLILRHQLTLTTASSSKIRPSEAAKANLLRSETGVPAALDH
jgi:hypothetical protein